MTALRSVLVTGGGGFVGRSFMTAAMARGWRVTVLERDAVAAVGLDVLGIPVIEHDVREPLPGEALRGIGAVVHLAAYVPPDLQAPGHAAECLAVNGLGTLNVLEAARSADVRRIVYLGAANAYAVRRRPARESDAMTPSGKAAFYLASKVLADTFVEHYGSQGGLRCTSLRASAIYGVGMPSHSMVFRFLSALRRGEALEVTDGGRYKVDLVYVDDVAGAIMAALERDVIGPVNVAGGRRYSSRQVAAIAARICSAPRRLVKVLPPAPGSAPVEFPAVDIHRARVELDFEPSDLTAGLRRMLAEDPRLAGEAQ